MFTKGVVTGGKKYGLVTKRGGREGSVLLGGKLHSLFVQRNRNAWIWRREPYRGSYLSWQGGKKACE